MTVADPAGRRRRAWLWLLAVMAVLALPTAIDPGSVAADVTYLCGEAFLPVVIFVAARRMARAERRPWLLLGTVTLMWLTGDLIVRLMSVLGWSTGRTGPPDVFWLGSYVVEILAINAMIRARRLPRPVVRDIRLDVLIITTAAALGDWLVIIEPELGSGQPWASTLTGLLYPLGDVVIFALALTVILIPGSQGAATIMLVTCLGTTLPLDFVYQTLATKVPSFDTGHIDAGLLVANSLLGAAALHPDRDRLAAPADEEAGRHLQIWRIGVLGLSLVTVSLTNVFVRDTGLRLIPGLVATLVISLAIILRFYRAARSQERATTALRRLAEHDQLTGAANRELLHRRLPDFVSGPQGLLVYIDLDGFKSLNDTHGHHMGDAVLCAVTRRLGEMVRAGDTVARIGGDEFVLLLHGCGAVEAPMLAQRILDDVRRPLSVDSFTLQVGASIGVVVLERHAEGCPAAGRREGPGRPDPAPDHAPDRQALADDVLRSADAAMYDVKRQGGGVRIVRYDTDLMAAS